MHYMTTLNSLANCVLYSLAGMNVVKLQLPQRISKPPEAVHDTTTHP